MTDLVSLLRRLGAILCDRCGRWTYRDPSAPCPFCVLEDA
ncbi:UNVERIFIED_ORG: hypothetical protein CLV66_10486 [Actinomadura viridilutea]